MVLCVFCGVYFMWYCVCLAVCVFVCRTNSISNLQREGVKNILKVGMVGMVGCLKIENIYCFEF